MNAPVGSCLQTAKSTSRESVQLRHGTPHSSNLGCFAIPGLRQRHKLARPFKAARADDPWAAPTLWPTFEPLSEVWVARFHKNATNSECWRISAATGSKTGDGVVAKGTDMAKETATSSEISPVVITPFGYYDIREDIEMLACKSSGAHVYIFPPDTALFDPTFVISGRPLTPTQVKRCYHNSEKEIAREELKEGVAPAEVWQRWAVSARDIGKIAKEEKIKLPRNWFAEANKENTHSSSDKPSENVAI